MGYSHSDLGFDHLSCKVISAISKQSPDIAMGVDRDDKESQGAGDQGLMFGYAINETKELMPATIQIAHDLVKKHSEVRNSGTIEWLRPDAKSQVTINFNNGKPKHIDTVVLSTQHDDNIDMEEIHQNVLEHIIKPILPDELVTEETRYLINPTGSFVIGGPVGDCGLTGRKIIVDTYGGMARHGGGAFSGKDPSKVDRSAAYAARYVAKNIVAAGLADRCEIQVSYAIGVAEPTSIRIKTFGTEKIQEKQIIQLVHNNFDLTPYGIMNMLDLLKPIYEKTAAYGHFGRENEELEFLYELIRTRLEKLYNDPRIHRNKMKVKAIGTVDLLPESIQDVLQRLDNVTKDYNNHFLNIAIAYGGQNELVDAVKKIGDQIEQGKLETKDITKEVIESNLYTSHLPQSSPDMILRTSGEKRMSGFLLWQSAYSELVFLDIFWPEFRKIDLMRAIRTFQKRKRRSGI
mgnify:CR=1 FL=1